MLKWDDDYPDHPPEPEAWDADNHRWLPTRRSPMWPRRSIWRRVRYVISDALDGVRTLLYRIGIR